MSNQGELVLKTDDVHTPPNATFVKAYFKSDGKLYSQDENGVETEIGSGTPPPPVGFSESVFYISQTGTNVPVIAQVIKDDLGIVGNITLQRFFAGQYFVILSNTPMVANKTVIVIGQTDNAVVRIVQIVTGANETGQFFIKQWDVTTGVQVDGIYIKTPLTIRVYT